MLKKVGWRSLALAAGIGTLAAARKVASAPPDPEIEKRADAAAYSGPWTHGYADVNGVRLHYAEVGSGPLVILLHGFPECWYTWHSVMPRLAAHFHVVAPDMRGYNWSSKPQGIPEYTSEKVASDITALIETFGETRAHVVGHDWGGNIAWNLGINHPRHVDKLVVINAPHPAIFARDAARPQQLLKSWYVFMFQLPVLPEAISRLLLRQILVSSAVIPGSFSEEALDVYENGLSQPGAATAMINYYRAAFRDAAKAMGQTAKVLERPTMVIWGMKDFALGPYLLDGLESYVPDLRVERVEESGHFVPEEKPRLVSDLLVEFFGG